MYDGTNVADQYSNSGEGQEIYVCRSGMILMIWFWNNYVELSSSGPAFGALGQGGFPPYTDFALNIDISNRSGLVGTYGYTGLGDASWATGIATDWYLDEIGNFEKLHNYRADSFRYPEVYGISSWQPEKGLFQVLKRLKSLHCLNCKNAVFPSICLPAKKQRLHLWKKYPVWGKILYRYLEFVDHCRVTILGWRFLLRI